MELGDRDAIEHLLKDGPKLMTSIIRPKDRLEVQRDKFNQWKRHMDHQVASAKTFARGAHEAALQEIQSEINTLRAQGQQCKKSEAAEYNVLVGEYNDLIDEWNSLRTTKNATKAERDAAYDRIARSDKEKEDLQTQLSALTAQLQLSKSSNDDLQTQVDTLQRQVQISERSNEDLQT